MKSSRYLRPTLILVAGSLTYTGCSTNGQGPSSESVQGGFLGGLGGAALGALAASVTGNTKNIAGYMAIGAALGATAGAVYGGNVARQKAKYKSDEAYLDDCRNQAEKARLAADKASAQLNTQIQQVETETAALVQMRQNMVASASAPLPAGGAAASVSAPASAPSDDQVRTVVARLTELQKAVDQNQAGVDHEIAEQKFALSQVDQQQPSAKELQVEIDRLEVEKANLAQETARLRQAQVSLAPSGPTNA